MPARHDNERGSAAPPHAAWRYATENRTALPIPRRQEGNLRPPVVPSRALQAPLARGAEAEAQLTSAKSDDSGEWGRGRADHSLTSRPAGLAGATPPGGSPPPCLRPSGDSSISARHSPLRDTAIPLGRAVTGSPRAAGRRPARLRPRSRCRRGRGPRACHPHPQVLEQGGGCHFSCGVDAI